MASSFAGFIEDVKAFVLTMPYDDDDSSQRSLEINEHEDNDNSDTADSTGDDDAEINSNHDNSNSIIDDDDAWNSGDATGYQLNIENDSVEGENHNGYSQVTSDSYGDEGSGDDGGDGRDDNDKDSDNGSATFVQAFSEMPAEWETSEEEQPNASSSPISSPGAAAAPTRGTTASRNSADGDQDSDDDNNTNGEFFDTTASQNTHTSNLDSTTTISPFLSGPNSPHKIEIRPVGLQKGLGMVALRPIAVNETIHAEAPLLVCPAGARSAREMQSFMLAAMAPLSEPDRDFVTHGLTNASGCRADVENHLAGVYRTNALPCGSGSGERFGAVFKALAMANHSCVPNARYRWVDAEEGGEASEMKAGAPKETKHENGDGQKSMVNGHDEKQKEASNAANDLLASDGPAPEPVPESNSHSSTPPSDKKSPNSNLDAKARDTKTSKPEKTTHNTTTPTKPSTTTIKGHGTLTALEPIPSGAEITISYIPHAPHTARRSRLHSSFNFWCTCALCSLPAGPRRDAEDARTAEIEGLELTLFSEPVAQLAARALSGRTFGTGRGSSERAREGGRARVREVLAKFERLLALYDGSEVNREPEALCACAAAVRLCVVGFEREEAVRLVGAACGFEEEVARGLCEEAAAEMEVEE